jgi:hypothetical protein
MGNAARRYNRCCRHKDESSPSSSQEIDVSTVETVTLYRPVGQKELELIRESGFRAFPARLPSQPIFYPVLDQDYAVQIARDWNTRDAASGLVGYVTRFRVRADFASRYPIQTAGSAKRHRELWVPADELAAFNEALVGPIEVIAEFHGSGSQSDPK